MTSDNKKAFIFRSSFGNISILGQIMNRSIFSPIALKQFIPIMCISCLLMLDVSYECSFVNKILLVQLQPFTLLVEASTFDDHGSSILLQVFYNSMCMTAIINSQHALEKPDSI